MSSFIKNALKGAAMGVAEVIPGVSGGTIAFITGIYEKLLESISNINPSLIKLWKTDGFGAVAQKINLVFLVQLFAGMAVGLVSGLFVVTHLLQNHPILIWSFFFGLILAAIPFVAKQVSRWKFTEVALLILGAIFVYWVTVALPMQGSSNLIIVFLSGVIAVSALMLPGLSGSFVLLLLGMYTIIMPALKNTISNPFSSDLLIVVAFGLGMLVGLFSFAKVLSFTFKKYPNPTLALLTGFLIGSLNKVWPWQEVISTRINSKGETVIYQSKSVWPTAFEELTDNFLYGTDPKLFAAVACMVVAFALTFLLEKWGSKE